MFSWYLSTNFKLVIKMYFVIFVDMTAQLLWNVSFQYSKNYSCARCVGQNYSVSYHYGMMIFF